MPCHPRHSGAVGRWRSSGTLSRTCASGVFFSTRSQRGQRRMGQHGQRDMAIPALPVAHLAGIQSAFTFRRLKGLLDQPALDGHERTRVSIVSLPLGA